MRDIHDRYIAYLQADTPLVSVWRILDKGLLHRPILVGATGGRGMVVDCCHETRRRGIWPGMPMRWARMRCPEAAVLPENREELDAHCARLHTLVTQRSPLCERAGTAAFYLDLTGMGWFGPWKWLQDLAAELRREVGFPLSYALASSKLVAGMGVDPRVPECKAWVRHGEEQRFIDPLPLHRLPTVGWETVRQFRDMRVHDIRALREVSKDILMARFGKAGARLWAMANAQDTTPVLPQKLKKTFSSHVVFDCDSIDAVRMTASLVKTTEELTSLLRAASRLAARIEVSVCYADKEVKALQATLKPTSDTGILREKAVLLFQKALARRQRIRQLTVTLSNLAYGGHQIEIGRDTVEKVRLDETIDRIKGRFGHNVLWSGSALGGVGHEAGVRESHGNESPHQKSRSHRPHPTPTAPDPQAWYPDPVYEEPVHT